jgi:hypothetical protein
MRPATVLFSSSTRWSYDLPIVGYPVSAIGNPRLEELLAERSDSKFLAVAK